MEGERERERTEWLGGRNKKQKIHSLSTHYTMVEGGSGSGWNAKEGGVVEESWWEE